MNLVVPVARRFMLIKLFDLIVSRANAHESLFATKKTLALYNFFESLALTIENSWVDVFVDSMTLFLPCIMQGFRS